VSAPGPVGGRAKRLFDLAVTVPLLVVLSPLLVGLAVWVRRDSPGPALFRQTRIGYAGRPFRVCKFRTMVVGAASMGTGIRVVSDDPRITRSGRWLRRTSLDELPQLLNVVTGDMSLVGPRPTVPEQVERYTDRQRRRLEARPGVTGLAQVRGRQALPWSRRIEIDIEYVEGWSMRRDLAILARTALVVLGRDDTYSDAAPAFDLPERPADGEAPPRG
jgi:lipopolysaccharide/colanic/teichoic acid biosynthesis glycosyltransferase